jgi:hypothetical protein
MFMRARAGIFIIIISLLFLVATVEAVGIPDTVTVNTDKPWIVANNVDQSIITVSVTNTTFPNNGPVSGVLVNFAVNDSAYGTFSSTMAITDASGKAYTTFKVKTKSGAAQITATINIPALSGSTIQNIDHDSPYIVTFTHPFSGTVATEVPFNLSVTDRWGNRIDNQNPSEIHNVSLHVHGPSPDDCGFNTSSGYKHDISDTLDVNGNLSAKIKLTSKIGTNNILMDSFGSISDKLESITAVATGVPYTMTGSISNGGSIPANGIDYFIIDYFLYDKYENLLGNRSIWVNTTLPNEQNLYTSNALGQIRINYGPKTAVWNNIPITAISIDNHSVTNTLYASFTNTGPTNMVLVVTPQSMASREVAPSQEAFVRATVVDLFGNPVPNELVRFNITSINNNGFTVRAINGTPSFSAVSYVDNITATTDTNGNAIVLFYPGSFPKRVEPGYNSAANASCVVEATWNTVTRYVKVTWKNYPYLSVEATAAPPTVHLNDTFDVNIRVTGDGYAMGGSPVTVVLDEDCTSNMFSNKDEPPIGAKRIDSAKAAAKVFVDQMIEGQDYVGFNSFGTEKNNQFDLPPQASMDLVKTKIDSLVKGTNGQGFVPSIYESLNNITATQPYRPQDEVRAVILLHDAGASSVSIAEEDAIVAVALAANPKIYIFTVLYYDGGSTSSSTEVTMRHLANKTGGQFFKPSTPDELKQAYIDIAGILRILAGVNATMNINYQNVEVNSTPMNGGLVFDYVPVENGMTSPDSRTTMLWPNNTRSFKNQSSEWTAANNYQLHFDIGTINISERWETTYRLKANQTGLIKLFDNTSTIIFNNGADHVEFPDLFITVTPNLTPQGTYTGILDVSNLVVTKSGNYTDFIPLQWNLHYEGTATATETRWYSFNNGPWVQFGAQSDIGPGDYTHYAQLDVKKFPPGGYRIKIFAVAPDAREDEEVTSAVTVGSTGIFIKLE